MTNTALRGVLKVWKDDRGFGFIQPDNGDKDIFLHISALRGMARRPNRGDVVFYEVAEDAGGKIKAVNARIEGVEYIEQASTTNAKWLGFALLGLGIVAGIAAYYFLNQAV